MATSETGDTAAEVHVPRPTSASSAAEPADAKVEQAHGAEHDPEMARLEGLLLERAREVRRLREQLSGEGRLLREMSKRFAEVPRLTAAAREQADALASAVSRAVEAEAGRAELAFRLDEALGLIHELRSRDVDDVALSEAKYAGMAKGLRAALAEAQEMRETADARCILLEDDLADSKRLVSRLQRKLAEAEEECELLRLQASERDEVQELRRRLIEAEEALSSVTAERDAGRSRADAAEQALAKAEADHAGEVSELRAALAQEQLSAGAVRAQLSEDAAPAATSSETASTEGLEEELRQACRMAEAMVKASQAEARALEHHLSSLHTEREEASARARTAEQGLAQTARECEQLRAELADARSALGAREAAMVATESALSEATLGDRGVESLTDTLLRLRQDLQELLRGVEARDDTKGPSATLTGVASPATDPPAADADAGDEEKLGERLARSEGHVRKLQGELGRERDLRSEERRRAEQELGRLSEQCESLRSDATLRAAKLHETARRARSLLALVPVGEPLAVQLGELLEALDA